jgi:cytochrome c556
MKMAIRTLAALLIPFTFGWALYAQEPSAAERPLVSIKEVMEKTITRASNTLWNVPDSPSDEEWAALEEASVTLLVGAYVVGLGGTGPTDDEWAEQPAWQAFNQLLIDAGRQALAATRARDVAALRTAGDPLYVPCEACHAQFNPGVVGAQ